ncbi:MAG TPA: calcium/sodium antiporter [Candidatus Latescibacteria bacterium]|nr:calcium/sodium antiporter [Candidatus Latescibacterota bacterium]
MSFEALSACVLGLISLAVGARFLVDGSSRLASALGISPLVVGLTVVAFGTSAPELAVSVHAAWAGQPDIAIGNAVGSNIINVLLILGASALITPLVVSQQLVRMDTPLMIGACVLVYVFSADGVLSRLNGIFLFACIVAYTVFAIRVSKRESSGVEQEYAREYGEAKGTGPRTWALTLTAILAGLGLLVLGSRFLVEGASEIARAYGLSELVIGLTIVAGGTSLPEIAASIAASARREPDIAVGNVVGSNLFNMLAVLGLSSVFSPAGVPVSRAAVAFDIPVMIGVCVACLPIFFTGYRIARWEGALLLAYWLAYTAYTVFDARGHEASSQLTVVMMEFVIPITLITLATITVRHMREKNRAVPQ